MPLAPFLTPLASTSLFSIAVSLFLFCYIHSFYFLASTYWSDNIQYLSLYLWLILLSIIPSRSTHVVASGSTSFHYTYKPQLYSFICWGHLRCCHTLATVNNAAMNTGVHVSFWNHVFVFFEYIPRGRIAGWYGRSIFIILMNSPYCFQ